MPEVDDDQFPTLRRLRAAFGPIEVVEVLSHDPVGKLPARAATAAAELSWAGRVPPRVRPVWTCPCPSDLSAEVGDQLASAEELGEAVQAPERPGLDGSKWNFQVRGDLCLGEATEVGQH